MAPIFSHVPTFLLQPIELTSCVPSVSEPQAGPHIAHWGLHDQAVASLTACLPAAQ